MAFQIPVLKTVSRNPKYQPGGIGTKKLEEQGLVHSPLLLDKESCKMDNFLKI